MLVYIHRRLAGLDTVFTEAIYDNPSCLAGTESESDALKAVQSIKCSYPDPNQSLSFDNLKIPFIYLCVGLGIGIAVLVLELIAFSMCHRKSATELDHAQAWEDDDDH